MKAKLLTLFAGLLFITLQAWAQQKAVTGKVTDDEGLPLPGVSVRIKGATTGTSTNVQGNYTIQAGPGQVLTFSFLGTVTQERTVGEASAINVQLRASTNTLSEVVVTGALGIKVERRSLGSAVQEVSGAAIAQSQRENFLNALQGRVAGMEVTNTSGLPGSSSSVIIRGVTSLSGSNQPLYVVDGIPIDNTTFNTGNLASGAQGSATSFENRSVDFSNRAADINPNDIESLTVLKGPEATALYGIDAASGVILITTKKGKAGAGRISYNNSLKISEVTRCPEVQQVYGQGIAGVSNNTSFTYLGPKYSGETQLFDNIKPFFRNAVTQKHNISFDGGTDKVTYRLTSAYLDETGIIPGTALNRLNLGTATTAKINDFISTDVTLNYTYEKNNQVFKGAGGALIGLLTWPSIDDASNYLTSTGLRRSITQAADLTTEPENPYFVVNKNLNEGKTNRLLANVAFNITPAKWFSSRAQVGFDTYSNEITIVRHPQSNYAFSRGGIIDNGVANNRNFNAQLLNTFKYSISDFNANLLVGGSLQDNRYLTTSVSGEGFLEPDFVNINNTDQTRQRGRSVLSQRRLLGVFANAVLDYKKTAYLTLTGRNDWTSTLPVQNRSFFSPSAQFSFVFTELNAFKDVNWVSSGKIRASAGSVGKDAPPYSIRPGLENQTTTGGGFGYGFTAPSPNLKAERTNSFELGTELFFLKDRLSIDAAYYQKKSVDQIIKDLRLSYGTGFILQVFNGGDITNKGFEIMLKGTPVFKQNFTWDIQANFDKKESKLSRLPQDLPEYYVSDTWLYSNVRNGAVPGEPVTTFTGFPYQRNINGDILISPTTGLPLRDVTRFQKIGDRNPDFSIGLNNSFRYKNLSLQFLIDMRKGGDVFNATEHYLTVRGLSKRTLDRETPIIVKGVLKDGLENSEAPTANTKQIIPYYNDQYYSTAGIVNEEDYIEKDINWIRLKDVTLSYAFSNKLLQRSRIFKSASAFVTATDLFLITNYSGLDPVVSGNNAAVGGSGSSGYDFGNFPFPVGINIGLSVGF